MSRRKRIYDREYHRTRVDSCRFADLLPCRSRQDMIAIDSTTPSPRAKQLPPQWPVAARRHPPSSTARRSITEMLPVAVVKTVPPSPSSDSRFLADIDQFDSQPLRTRNSLGDSKRRQDCSSLMVDEQWSNVDESLSEALSRHSSLISETVDESRSSSSSFSETWIYRAAACASSSTPYATVDAGAADRMLSDASDVDDSISLDVSHCFESCAAAALADPDTEVDIDHRLQQSPQNDATDRVQKGGLADAVRRSFMKQETDTTLWQYKMSRQTNPPSANLVCKISDDWKMEYGLVRALCRSDSSVDPILVVVRQSVLTACLERRGIALDAPLTGLYLHLYRPYQRLTADGGRLAYDCVFCPRFLRIENSQ